eukprot:Pompholyxophrys_punicea_v1_NODE_288_length_2379_cov_34.988812.p2 type:complete len:135 gc:universal NODE_288_length_2379_cov_34.988812:1065-661(-)
MILHGWPKAMEEGDLIPYFKRASSVDKGCILWGLRVVIPENLRKRVLQRVHEGHPGIVKGKTLLRGYFWWPKLDQELEAMVRSCVLCQEAGPNPKKELVIPWQIPDGPWSRVHIDFCVPMDNEHFLIAVDAYSK